jgi:hypothetical protein
MIIYFFWAGTGCPSNYEDSWQQQVKPILGIHSTKLVGFLKYMHANVDMLRALV